MSDDVVLLEVANKIATVTFNRPQKRNAMNPALNVRMLEVLDDIEGREDVGVVVLTGAGESWSAGMDLKEYFRDNDDKPRAATLRARRQSGGWWQRLMYLEKPTIAMVNGWCFGGAFTPLVACDLAIAAEDAKFGLSEINWGILPGGNVTRAVAEVMRHRDALYYIMTGELFDGRKAAEMGLVNEAVPSAQLHQRVHAIANVLLEKNPVTLKAAKDTFKRVRNMPWEAADDYIYAKLEQMLLLDKSGGRNEGLRQFLDDKSYRPGLGAYKRD
jgi:trans-feruloyl-CoA hydratase/vanillin synthase